VYSKLIITVAFVAAMAAGVAGASWQMHTSAEATPPDMIVGIAPGAPLAPKSVTIMPSGWAQPAYSVWVSAKCANSLEVGDSWPSPVADCKAPEPLEVGVIALPVPATGYPTETAGPWIPRAK
jgi:hypothetical protein